MNEEIKTPESSTNSDIEARVVPILEHLKVPGTEIDPSLIRERFVQMWKFEEADKLSPENQFLTTVAIFIYVTHNFLDDYNIRPNRSKEYIISALTGWQKPETDKMVATERASDNPFKAFVNTNLPKVDEIYTWENFQLEHKHADEKQWTYKMKKCWFADFFIRLGRVDYIETACQFDQIPWNARKDFVSLKLNNQFRKLGKICQFNYKPAEPRE